PGVKPVPFLIRFDLIVTFDISEFELHHRVRHRIVVFVLYVSFKRRNLCPNRAGCQEDKRTQKEQTSELHEHKIFPSPIPRFSLSITITIPRQSAGFADLTAAYGTKCRLCHFSDVPATYSRYCASGG